MGPYHKFCLIIGLSLLTINYRSYGRQFFECESFILKAYNAYKDGQIDSLLVATKEAQDCVTNNSSQGDTINIKCYYMLSAFWSKCDQPYLARDNYFRAKELVRATINEKNAKWPVLNEMSLAIDEMLTVWYEDMGQIDSAIFFAKSALQMVQQVSPTKLLDIALHYQKVANLFEDLDSDSALAYHIYALRLREQDGSDIDAITNSYQHISFNQSRLHRYYSAVVSKQIELDLLLRRKNIFPTVICSKYNDLAQAYEGFGLMDSAIKYYQKSHGLLSSSLGTCDSLIANSLHTIGNCFLMNELDDSALSYYKKELIFNERCNIIRSDVIALCLLHIGGAFLGKKEYDSALHYLNRAYHFREKESEVRGVSDDGYYHSLKQLYLARREFDSALKFQHLVLGIHKNLPENNYKIAKALEELAVIHFEAKNFDSSLFFMRASNKILAEQLPSNSPEFVSSLSSLAVSYATTGMYDSAIMLLNKGVESSRENAKDAFRYLDHKNFALYNANINSLQTYGGLLDAWISKVYKTRPDLVKFSFDFKLFITGLQLNLDHQLYFSLSTSSDTQVQYRYNQIRNWRMEIASLEMSKDGQSKRRIDSLNLLVTGQISWLRNSSNAFQNAITPLQLRTDSIRGLLRSNEAAIQYINYLPSDSGIFGEQLYAAIVIRKDKADAIWIPLCSGDILKQLLASEDNPAAFYGRNSSKSLSLYNLVWKPFDTCLKGIKTIWISTVGILSKTNILAINNGQNQIISEQYDVHRVLFFRKINQPKRFSINSEDSQISASLFGDIDFGYKIGVNDHDGKNAGENRLKKELQRCDDGFRQGFGNLPHTQIEIHDIDSILKSYQIVTKVYSDTIATEIALKSQCNSKSPYILHLATHGFYYTSLEKFKYKSAFSDRTKDLPMYMISEDPMQRCGLAFAGARTTFKIGGIYSAENDGCLTGKEISELNLQNTQLAVLSACESGLGEVHQNEGVYGLQRAFYQAGVNSLITSMWKIDDEATSEFMKYFYINLMVLHFAVHDAFYKTQLQFANGLVKSRSGRKDLSDAAHWAAFTLLE